jgi:hypothetical protein
MSKSDHSKSRFDRFNDGDRVTRRHALVSKREHIADELAIHTDAELVDIADALTEAITWTSETPVVVEHVHTSEIKVDYFAQRAEAARRRSRVHYSLDADDSELMMTSRKYVRPVTDEANLTPSLMAMAKRA